MITTSLQRCPVDASKPWGVASTEHHDTDVPERYNYNDVVIIAIYVVIL